MLSFYISICCYSLNIMKTFRLAVKLISWYGQLNTWQWILHVMLYVESTLLHGRIQLEDIAIAFLHSLSEKYNMLHGAPRFLCRNLTFGTNALNLKPLVNIWNYFFWWIFYSNLSLSFFLMINRQQMIQLLQIGEFPWKI